MIKIYKEPSELSQYQRQQGDFKVLWPFVKAALAQNIWLFNKESREWYTPEEFLAAFKDKKMNNYEVSTLNRNLIIRDPRDGNMAYHREIERRTEQYQQDILDLRMKGEAFLNKVIGYYKEKV